jgi:hypothetical protein
VHWHRNGAMSLGVIASVTVTGEIWGDVQNSRERADGTRFGSVDGQIVEILDNRANSDKFRWTAGVTIKDAQKSAANDNDAWREATFRFVQGEAA